MAEQNNIKYWTYLAGFILIVAVTVTLIDLTIKSAILQESNRLKRLIWDAEGQLYGQGQEGANNSRIDPNASVGSYLPGDLLDTSSPRMETGIVSNGDQKKTTKTPGVARKARQMGEGNTDVSPAD